MADSTSTSTSTTMTRVSLNEILYNLRDHSEAVIETAIFFYEESDRGFRSMTQEEDEEMDALGL